MFKASNILKHLALSVSDILEKTIPQKRNHVGRNGYANDPYAGGPPGMTKPMIVGCACGNAVVTREWDADLGAYYYFYDCGSCNYHWEGPMYVG